MSDYKLVPVEPTAEMIEAGKKEADWYEHNAIDCYQAMLAAAPAVQGEPVYLYRRRGFRSFETCNHVQYAELSAKPRFFETKVLYTAPQPAPDVSALVEALEQIERWDGFPATDEVWEDSGEPVSYGAAFGSNGERDFMREVARKALAAYRKQEPSNDGLPKQRFCEYAGCCEPAVGGALCSTHLEDWREQQAIDAAPKQGDE